MYCGGGIKRKANLPCPISYNGMGFHFVEAKDIYSVSKCNIIGAKYRPGFYTNKSSMCNMLSSNFYRSVYGYQSIPGSHIYD